ncbi:N-acetylmuramoyl-L-alanine amidase [Paenisporosarcina sp. NPDC076898]|uniref:N-acetylmuramoyl-L-alanine amidase n=1 Tax=unclassified Paenisporosarcina TaxID=2642018 RepID=UPI003D04CE47
MHSLVVRAMRLKDRGLKKQNFHVLREESMPAILIEGGYMDSIIDMESLRDDSKLKSQGEAIAEGLVKFYKLQKRFNESEVKGVSKMEEYNKDAQPSKSQVVEFKAAVAAGITDGTYPQRPASREEVAVTIYRVTKNRVGLFYGY